MARFEISKGIAIEVENDSQSARILTICEEAKTHAENLLKHGYDYKDGYDYSVLSKLVEETWRTDWHKYVYDVYREVSCAEDIAYRKYAEADFLEYASHKDEADFDWDFYSDWHKDVYGFRPRR